MDTRQLRPPNPAPLLAPWTSSTSPPTARNPVSRHMAVIDAPARWFSRRQPPGRDDRIAIELIRTVLVDADADRRVDELEDVRRVGRLDLRPNWLLSDLLCSHAPAPAHNARSRASRVPGPLPDDRQSGRSTPSAKSRKTSVGRCSVGDGCRLAIDRDVVLKA